MNNEELKKELMEAMEAERIEQESENAEKGVKTPWYLKLATLARILIVGLESGNGKLSGADKSAIIVNTLATAWEAFCPLPIRAADKLTCGILKKLVLNVINDVIVLVYNKLLGHKWFKEAEEEKEDVDNEKKEVV